jgi:polynucleotide 5'-hydroxyl-kinase GRC3/NOL9
MNSHWGHDFLLICNCSSAPVFRHDKTSSIRPFYFPEKRNLHAVAHHEIIVPPEWDDLLVDMKVMPEMVAYVLGAMDTGKSTLCRYLVQELSREATTGYLDCDTGQSTIGPPGTIGLSLFEDGEATLSRPALRFVGSTSPSGHLIQEMAGAARLLQLAKSSDASFVIIDSPGWVADLLAGEFHIRMIDLLAPSEVVGISGDRKLDPILANFRERLGMRIRTLVPSPYIQSRSRSWRACYRDSRFEEYFTGAVSWEIPLAGMGFHGRVPDTFRDEDWRGLLVALCGPDMLVISLAIVETLDMVQGVIRFRAPVDDLEGISSIQVGSVHLDPDLGFTKTRG